MSATDLHAEALARIAERRALIAAGTPGPWVRDAFFIEGRYPWPGSRPGEIIAQALNTARDGDRAQHERNAALIVAAVNDYGPLLDLAEAVLLRHRPSHILDGEPVCSACKNFPAWSKCPDATAALRSLGLVVRG